MHLYYIIAVVFFSTLTGENIMILCVYKHELCFIAIGFSSFLKKNPKDHQAIFHKQQTFFSQQDQNKQK